jgi:phosphoribosylanthranilate isomerase
MLKKLSSDCGASIVVKVKICGITNLADAQAAIKFGADALGFVFAESPRAVTPESAKKIISALGPFVTTVGVFVNEKPQKVTAVAKLCGLSAVQLHGDETPSYTKKLRCCKVIKAFRVGAGFDLKKALIFPADAYLFDSKVSGQHGGSGKSFDWQLLKGVCSRKPVILSGGIHSGNVRKAVQVTAPYAVDASSGVESRPGKKDHKLLKEFIYNAKRQ